MNDAVAPVSSARRRRGGRRRLAALLAVGVAALGLAGCTARMDMTISADGTYDVTVEMRDTTGTVFDAEPDCSPYTDPSIIGAAEGTEVTATALTGDEGSGCLVTITGVSVPDADDATADTSSSSLVVRDGDLYVVTLPALFSDEDTATSTGAATDAATVSPTDSLDSLAEARVSVTFPGAVVDSGGGTVSGRTVTWQDADAVAAGVSASGYAVEGAGTHPWRSWLAGGLVALGLALGAGLVVRYRRRSG